MAQATDFFFIPSIPLLLPLTTKNQKFAGVLLDLNGAQACIQIFIQKNGIFFDNNYEPGENLKYVPPVLFCKICTLGVKS